MLELDIGFFFLLGAIFGSFANVLILRMPDEKSIVEGSHCTSCHKKIRWYHNLPLISWFLLRGRCAYCKAPFSFQYAVVEWTMALLFVFAFLVLGWSWYLLEILIFIFASVTASFIDLKHYILPDELTLGGLVLALLGALLNPERNFMDAFYGCLLGGGFLYLTAYVHYFIRKVEGMGGGDIKLLAWIGAVMGWQSIFPVLMFAAFTGAVVGFTSNLIFRRSLKEPIPFGPFLTLAALLYVLLDTPTIVQVLFYR